MFNKSEMESTGWHMLPSGLLVKVHTPKLLTPQQRKVQILVAHTITEALSPIFRHAHCTDEQCVAPKQRHDPNLN